MLEKERQLIGYRRMDHGGLSWLANEEGARFIIKVGGWSPQGLAIKQGWIRSERHYHTLYLAQGENGKRYLIKTYPLKGNYARPFSRKANRARREFNNTLIAHREGIPTVLPLAVGEGKEHGRWSVILYPFLDKAVSLARVYSHGEVKHLSIRERQCLEKKVGMLVRKLIDKGIYPRDLVLDHFLANKENGDLLVHLVDLERVEFARWFRRKKGIGTLGSLLARMEWFRISGWRINRSSVMRIGYACFHAKQLQKLDKRLCRAVIQTARKYWFRREFNKRRPGLLGSIELGG